MSESSGGPFVQRAVPDVEGAGAGRQPAVRQQPDADERGDLASLLELYSQVPRDRRSSFAPQFVGKHQRRFDGFDDKIISPYARAGGRPGGYHTALFQITPSPEHYKTRGCLTDVENISLQSEDGPR